MPVYLLTQELLFPPPSHSEPDGLLAVGGDLSVSRLLLAYSNGIFPWYNESVPILWYSPNPRMVLRPPELRINRSLRKAIRKHTFTLRMDTAFPQVIQACARIPRPGQQGTWITRDMLNAYIELHEQGFAHSIETWSDGKLVGGLYGVCLGDLFCGESMFALEENASKVAFVAMVRQLQRWGIELIDCQVYTDYLAHFGAQLIQRKLFLKEVHRLTERPTRIGPWTFDDDFVIDPSSASS